MLFIEIIIGGLVVLAFLYAFHFGKESELKGVLAIGLVAAALIYVGFALFGLWAKTANFNWLLLEFIGVVVYFLFAFLGVKKSMYFLAIGWAAHVLWDVGWHFGDSAAFVPNFYPSVCIGFDLVIAIYIFWRFYGR